VVKGKNAPFGWVKVKGSIDGIEFNKYHLMPIGGGRLFLPVYNLKSENAKYQNRKVNDVC
jgi:hypothetical protein